MNIFVRAAIAAVLVVGVGLLAVNVLPRQSDGSVVGGQPTASPSPSASAPPSPAQSAAGIPELTQTYVSSLNGYSIGYADDATITPATAVSNPDVEQGNADNDFIQNEPFATFRGVSMAAPDGVVIDEWIDRAVGNQPGGCAVHRVEQPEITIDGQPGRIWEGCPGEIEATVVVGRRVYVFSLFGEGETVVSRDVFDAYTSTIDLRPEDAASPAP